MFTVKILDVAKKAGAQAIFVKDATRAREKLLENPVLLILDLNYDLGEPFSLIAPAQALKIPTLGFLSHVQVDLKRKAEEAGCDRVVPRSIFSQKLPELIAESLA